MNDASNLALEEICFFAAGENALTMQIAETISLEHSERVHFFYNALQASSIHGVLEIVPAYTTLTFIFDVLTLRSTCPNAEVSLHQFIEEQILRCLQNNSTTKIDSSFFNQSSEQRIIPVCYEGDYAPDLAETAAHAGISPSELIHLHTAHEYRVAMIGFTPGFPYLLGLPPILAMPRKSVPRTRIEAGSVGIAGVQTGIYPRVSPGGWNIIGRTPLQLFLPNSPSLTLLKSGDTVRFRAVSEEEFLFIATRDDERIENKQRSYIGGFSTQNTAPFHNGEILVKESRFHATIQDEGRVDTRQYGISSGGAADRFAAVFANILVGNARNNAVLEIPFGKITLYFPQETLICCVGENVRAQAMTVHTAMEVHANSITEEIPSLRPVLMKAGTTLQMQHSSGLRAYLAVSGGIDVPVVVQSRSTDLKAGLGGLYGRALQATDRLPIGIPSPEERVIAESLRTFLKTPLFEWQTHFSAPIVFPFRTPQKVVKMRFTEGNEWSELDEDSRKRLQEAEFRVVPASDRMGIRLQATSPFQIKRTKESQLISRAVLPGSVQCTPDGTLILLLADAQTTGGYPIIAHVCSVDISRAAQVLPHQTLFFEKITLHNAENLYFEQEKELQQLSLRVQRMCRYGKYFAT
jgi:KipI family sensor histidine kinase inhibitor